MHTLKTLARLMVPAALTLGVAATDAAAQTAPAAPTAPLTLQVYNADANSFHVNAVLVSGQTDAVLLDGLGPLVATLRADGYRVIGPTVRDGAITLDELESADALPYGYGVETGPGR